jgi:hypothetical protein
MSNRLLLIIVGLLVANLFFAVNGQSSSAPERDSDGSIGLQRPWFIDQAFASEDRSSRAVIDIATEAGISAYVKTPAAINMTLARTAFTSIIQANTDYILGTITPTGYDGDFGAQVMVHRTGWIMAWYHKDQVASMIVHVNDTTFANKTKLSLIIDAVTTKLRITAITPSYYHFKYPNANRMVIARKLRNNGTLIRVSLPLTVIVSESSSYINSGCGYNYPSRLWINSEEVKSLGTCEIELDYYFAITDKLDAAVNTIEFDKAQLAVVIIYQA